MKTGHGSVKIRSKYEIDKQKIIFTEIPYGTTIEGLMTEIGEISDVNFKFFKSIFSVLGINKRR